MIDNLLSTAEAAKALGIKPTTLRQWVWTRKIEFVKLGRSVRFRESAIQKIIENGIIPEGLRTKKSLERENAELNRQLANAQETIVTLRKKLGW